MAVIRVTGMTASILDQEYLFKAQNEREGVFQDERDTEVYLLPARLKLQDMCVDLRAAMPDHP
jgi:hypothetical protein